MVEESTVVVVVVWLIVATVQPPLRIFCWMMRSWVEKRCVSSSMLVFRFIPVNM